MKDNKILANLRELNAHSDTFIETTVTSHLLRGKYRFTTLSAVWSLPVPAKNLLDGPG